MMIWGEELIPMEICSHSYYDKSFNMHGENEMRKEKEYVMRWWENEREREREREREKLSVRIE